MVADENREETGCSRGGRAPLQPSILAPAPGSRVRTARGGPGHHAQTYNRLFKQIKQLGRFNAVVSTQGRHRQAALTEDEIQR
jgi:hypothetical protein